MMTAFKKQFCWIATPSTLLLLVTGCDIAAPPPDDFVEVQPILTVRVANLSWEENPVQTRTVFGRLAPARESRLTFGRPGRVAVVNADQGDRVAAGETLAELDLAADRAQLRSLEATFLQPSGQPGSNQEPVRQQQLADVRGQIEAGTIVAPYDCIVTERRIDVGDGVAASSVSFQIVEDSQPIVTARVPQVLSSTVSEGSRVWVVVEEDKIPAEVRRRSPLQDAAAAQEIEVSFTEDLPTERWNYGQAVELRFDMSSQQSGYRVPLSALSQSFAGLWSVYTVAPAEQSEELATIVSRSVEILMADEESALINGALGESEQVVIDGIHRVVPGQIVKVQTDDNDSLATDSFEGTVE